MFKAIWDALNVVIGVLWFIFDMATRITRFWSVQRQAMDQADIESGKVIDPALVEKYAKFKREPK